MFGGYEFDIPTFYKHDARDRDRPSRRGLVPDALRLASLGGRLALERGRAARAVRPDRQFRGAASRAADRASRRRSMAAIASPGSGIIAPAFRTRRISSPCAPRRRQRRAGARPCLSSCRSGNSPCSTIGAATRRWACAPRARTASRSRTRSSPHRMSTYGYALWRAQETTANGTPGTRLHGNPMYLGRTSGPYQMSLVTPIIGAARAAIEEFETIITRREITRHQPGVLRFKHADYQRTWGQATSLADAAEGIMLAVGDKYMWQCRHWAETGHPANMEDELRHWTMVQHARQARRRGGRTRVRQRQLGRDQEGPEDRALLPRRRDVPAATSRRSSSISRRPSPAPISACRSKCSGCKGRSASSQPSGPAKAGHPRLFFSCRRARSRRAPSCCPCRHRYAAL